MSRLLTRAGRALATMMPALAVCVALGWWIAFAPARSIGDVLDSPPAADARERAYIVVRPEDCRDNLRFASVFERPAIARHIALRSFLVVGSEHDAAGAQAYIDSVGIGGRARALPRGALAALAALGPHATPLVLVLGHRGELRLALDAPQSPEEYVAMALLLATLRGRA